MIISHDQIEQARVSAAALPPDEAVLWVAKFDELQNECGCAVGARFFFATLVLYPAVWYWLIRFSISSLWYAALIGIVVLFISAGLGKFVGILVARYRLRSAVRNLLNLTEQHGG